jgi:hypothetical protein
MVCQKTISAKYYIWKQIHSFHYRIGDGFDDLTFKARDMPAHVDWNDPYGQDDLIWGVEWRAILRMIVREMGTTDPYTLTDGMPFHPLTQNKWGEWGSKPNNVRGTDLELMRPVIQRYRQRVHNDPIILIDECLRRTCIPELDRWKLAYMCTEKYDFTNRGGLISQILKEEIKDIQKQQLRQLQTTRALQRGRAEYLSWSWGENDIIIPDWLYDNVYSNIETDDSQHLNC